MDPNRVIPQNSPASPSPLRAVRSSFGLSARAFAAALGVSSNRLLQIENGERPIPQRVKAALEIAGVNVADLERDQTAWRERERVRNLNILRERAASQKPRPKARP